MPIVEHHGPKSHWSYGTMLPRTQYSLRWPAMTSRSIFFLRVPRGRCHEDSALRPIFLLVRYLNPPVRLLLRQTPSPPHGDDGIAKVEQDFESRSSVRIFRNSTGRPSGPTFLRFTITWIASSSSYLNRTSPSDMHGGHTLSSSISWVKGRRLGICRL